MVGAAAGLLGGRRRARTGVVSAAGAGASPVGVVPGPARRRRRLLQARPGLITGRRPADPHVH